MEEPQDRFEVHSSHKGRECPTELDGANSINDAISYDKDHLSQIEHVTFSRFDISEAYGVG